MPRSDSQDERNALRSRYGNTGPSRSTRALRSRPSRKISRNLPPRTIIDDGRSVVSSAFHLEQSVADDSLLSHGIEPEATVLVENTCPRQDDPCAPQVLNAATPLVPNCPPSYPDELRRGFQREQTPRPARAVLTTPFVVEPLKTPPAHMADVSCTQSKWNGREPPAPPLYVSGTTDTTGPGECASHPGLDDEPPAKKEPCWDPSSREGERSPTAFQGMC